MTRVNWKFGFRINHSDELLIIKSESEWRFYTKIRHFLRHTSLSFLAPFTWFSFICILSNGRKNPFHTHRMPFDRSQKRFGFRTKSWSIRRRFTLHREKVFHHKHFHFSFGWHTTRQNQLNPFLSALNQIRFSSVSVFFCLLCSLSEISVCYPWLSFITCFVHAAHIHTQYSTIYFIRI